MSPKEKESLRIVGLPGGVWAVGRLSVDESRRGWATLHMPLILRYRKNESVNGLSVELTAFDPVVLPPKIDVIPQVVYSLNEVVLEEYLSTIEKLYGKSGSL